MNLPADATFVAAGRDRVIWSSCGASCLLHVTDLTTGARCCLATAAELATVTTGLPAATGEFRPGGPALGPPARPP